MNTVYYDTVDRMQKQGVDPEYIIGWASGTKRKRAANRAAWSSIATW